MYRGLFLMVVLSFSLGSYAQLETSADFRRQVYDREYTLGLIGHSRGYSVNGRYLKFIDGFNKQGLEVDLAKIRHPKEVRQSAANQFYGSSRGFVYSRINSFYTLRSGYIREHILYDKTDQGTVSISLITSGGLSLGLLKPIYVYVNENGSGRELEIVRYNPPEHNASNPSEANFFKGIGETKLRPGIYVKAGFNFDYQLVEKKVTALEVGVAYDYFFAEVPIFYEEQGAEDINWSGFFQMYVALNFGYRKN